MFRRTVRTAVFILFAIVRVAQAADVLGPERPVSRPVYAPPAGTQRPGAVASDGSNFLVVWSDEAAGRAGLYVGHVAANGAVAPIPQLPLRSGTIVRDISACWTGSRYLITWNDDAAQSAMVATVSRDGELLTEPRVLLQGARVIQGGLASNGRHAFLVYFALPSIAIQGALLDSTGVLIRTAIPTPASFTNFDILGDSIKVATDGRDFAFFWSTIVYVPLSTTGPVASATPPPLMRPVQTFHVARLSDSGDSLDSGVVIATTGQTGGFGVAFGASRYSLAAMERPSGVPAPDVAILRRIIVDSQTLQSHELPQVPTTGFSASVAWNGEAFIAYWMRYSSNFFELDTLRFDGASESGPPQIAIAASGQRLATTPFLASNGMNVLAVWMDSSRSAINGLGADIFAAMLDNEARAPILAELAAFPIAFSSRSQTMPAIATSGLISIVAWLEHTMDDNRGRLLATRLAADGSALDAEPIDIADALVDVNRIEAAFIGSGFFVVWSQADTVYGRMIDGSGKKSAILSFGSGTWPSIAANGSVALVVFQRAADIVGIRVSPRGDMIDTTPLVVGAQRYGYSPDVAANVTDFLVVWTEGSDYWQFPSPNLRDVVGARVTGAGSVDASPIAIATGPQDQSGAVVASDGRDYLVVYLLGNPAGSGLGGPSPSLAAKRVLREGQLDQVTASDDGAIVASNASAPAIVFVQNDYAVAWQSESPPGGRSTISLAHVDQQGRRTGDGQIVAQSDVGPLGPALATAAHQLLDIAYYRLATEPQYASSMRVFVRVAGQPPRVRATRH
jgi:hypothetical protein